MYSFCSDLGENDNGVVSEFPDWNLPELNLLQLNGLNINGTLPSDIGLRYPSLIDLNLVTFVVVVIVIDVQRLRFS
jgi:hypothetical protein